MSPRSRIIAVQAIVVGVLVAVAVAVFLLPEDSPNSIAINGPQSVAGAFPGPDSYDDDHGDGAEHNGASDGPPAPGGASNPGGAAPGSAGAASPSVQAPAPPATESPPDTGDSPADDQYTDSLTRLMGRL